MLRYIFFTALIALSLAIASCDKTEVNSIGGNVAPQDTSISNDALQAYVNRLFIVLVGRKASDTEYNQSMQELMKEKGSKQSRKKIVNDIFSRPEYFTNLSEVARRDFLDGVTDVDIQSQIQLYQSLLNDPQYEPVKYIFQQYITNMGLLLTVPAELQSKKMKMHEMHALMVNNVFYDEINMGTENFVVSTFQNFLNRYPTNVELEMGKKMVDGIPTQLFLQNGQSKADYIKIFFSSNAYYEGQVVYLFEKYLFRKPTTTEMYDNTMAYMKNNDYQALQLGILTSDEYLKP